MSRRKRRVDRKLHRRYLELGVVDASQDSKWRRTLFDSPEHDGHIIDARNCAGLPNSVTYGIRRYGLSYWVSKVPQHVTPFRGSDWKGLVFFRFAARRYPDLVSFSANNPDVP